MRCWLESLAFCLVSVAFLVVCEAVSMALPTGVLGKALAERADPSSYGRSHPGVAGIAVHD